MRDRWLGTRAGETVSVYSECYWPLRGCTLKRRKPAGKTQAKQGWLSAGLFREVVVVVSICTFQYKQKDRFQIDPQNAK